jgi:prevent-host-death family protein
MSNQVGLRELRQHASAVIKRVRGGESVEITDHGHPIARIVPLHPSTLDQLVLDGRASGASADLLDVLDELGLPHRPDGRSPSRALEELRADER